VAGYPLHREAAVNGTQGLVRISNESALEAMGNVPYTCSR
jgi:hypothetical protein